jgi:hypothetical protein
MTEPKAFDPKTAGLCASCIHARRIESARGSVFLLCAMSQKDPAFPRYPRLPVLACPGYSSEPETSNDNEKPAK